MTEQKGFILIQLILNHPQLNPLRYWRNGPVANSVGKFNANEFES